MLFGLTSLFISNRKAPNRIIKLPPKIMTKVVKSFKVLSERSPFVISKANKIVNPRRGRKMFSEKYNPPS